MNGNDKELERQMMRSKFLLQQMPPEVALQVVAGIINSPGGADVPILSTGATSGIKIKQVGGVVSNQSKNLLKYCNSKLVLFTRKHVVKQSNISKLGAAFDLIPTKLRNR